MRRKKRSSNVSRYANMPIDQVNARLRALGINPQPTIDAVRNLVEQKLKHHHRGLLHVEEILNRIAHATLPIVRSHSFEMIGM